MSPNMDTNNNIVTIDGPAGSGKSTVAELLAQKLNWAYLDTGAMYRTVTLAAMRCELDMNDLEALEELTRNCDIGFTYEKGNNRVYLGNKEVTDEIRDPNVTAHAKHAASNPAVRALLVEQQQKIAQEVGPLVTEGRDQGTVAFPNAKFKFYLEASPETRAQRRFQQLQQQGRKDVTYPQILADQQKRDQSDAQRQVGPMKPAPDAQIIDTSDLNIEQVVDKLHQIITAETAFTELPQDTRITAPRFYENVRNWYRFTRSTVRNIFRLIYTVKVYGRDNIPETGPVLLVCNHQSFLDPMLIPASIAREVNFMARDTLFKNPIFGRLISSLSAFPVARGQADVTSIKQIIEKLKQDKVVLLFPEGTRTTDGRITKVKSGFDLIARRGKAFAVPVVIEGAFEAWPRNRKLPGTGHHISIMFGKPVSPQQAKDMPRDQLVHWINNELRRMQNQLRQKMNRPPFSYKD